MKVVNRDISSIKPYENNPRQNKDAVESVAKSIKEFGFRQPIVVDSESIIIVGHTRYLAALKLGLKKVPVHVATDLTSEQVSAYRIADNKTGEEAQWNYELLPLELDSLTSTDFDIELTGFTLKEVDALKSGKQAPGWLFVLVGDLKPHPKNYREHPADQLGHIIASIEKNGIYRNVVVAQDNTILAGHGVVQAATKMGFARLPVIRLNIDPDEPRALRILAGDNEISNLAEINDRMLTDMLKEIGDEDVEGLVGTGFTKESLAAIAMVTRPASEIADKNAANEWVGMPEYDEGEEAWKLIILFKDPDERDRFIREKEIESDAVSKKKRTLSTRWPWTGRVDRTSVRFEEAK